MALVLAVFGVRAGSLYADASFVSIVPISDGNAATDERGRANTPINAVSFKRQSLTTIGGYQFVSYYHHDGKLMIGRRKQVGGTSGGGTGWTDWTLRKTAFTSFNINDSHNTSTIAVDGDGFLHVAWGLHNNVMQYTRSTAPITNDNAFTLTNDTVGNNTTTGVLGQEIPLYNQSITYPEFYNVPGSGDLLLTYRTGGSGNGDYHLVKWNNGVNDWQNVRVGTSGDSSNPWIDNDFAGDSMPNGNAYLNNLVFSSTNKLVATWTIRTGGDSTSGFTDFQSNHNFYYAASDPNDPSGGGYLTWRKSDGTLYRRNNVHDIDEGNAQRILQIPEGSSLINQAAMAIDSNDRPIIASWWAPNAASGNHLRQYMIAYDDGTGWKTAQVSNRNAENGNARVPESQLNSFSMSRPIVLVDDDDRVLVVYRDYQRGNGITVSFSESDLRNDWQTLDLTTENLGGWEPSYDRQRWENAGVLSMYYQPINGATASTVSVMEWDARAYFATTPGQVFWDVDANGAWSTATNWSNDVVPGGVGAAVRFGGSGATMTAHRTIDLAGARTIGNLTLNGIGGNGFTLGGTGASLALDNGALPAGVNVSTGSHTIAVPVTIGASGADFNVSSAGQTLTLTSSINGAGDLTKSGTGTLVLAGGGVTAANNYDRTLVTGGVLQVGNGGISGALSSGSVSVSGAGTVAFNRSGNITVGNAITGADGFVRQDGPGVLTLTGVNNFGTGIGGVVVNNGVLRRGAAASLASGVNVVTHGTGVLDLGGLDLTAGMLSGTGGSISDRTVGSVGTTALQVGGSGTGDYAGAIADGTSRTLALVKAGTGTQRLRGASNFSGGTTLTRGVIEAYHNDALGTGRVTMNPTPGTAVGDAAHLELTNGVRLSNPLTMQTANAGVATGSLQIVSGSATYAGAITINGIATTGGHFAGPATGGTLRIEGAVTADASVPALIARQGRVAFAGGGSYAGLEVRAGTAFVGATNGIANNAIVDLAGNGSTSAATVLDLSGFNQQIRGLKNTVAPSNAALVTNTSPLTAVRTLTLSSADAVTNTYGGSIRGNLALHITGAGRQILTKTGTTSLNGIYDYTGGTVIDGADAMLQLNPAAFGVALTSGAGVDVRNGRLSFDFSSGGTDPTLSLLSILDAGYDVGFASGRIRSSTATGNRGLGWRSVGTNQFLITATLYGDANLDGAVNFADLVALAQNYNLPSGGTWATGDANYDGAVNFADLVALAQNYNASITPQAVASIAGAEFAADWALAQALVPEPGSALTLLGAIAGMASCLRKGRKASQQRFTITIEG